NRGAAGTRRERVRDLRIAPPLGPSQATIIDGPQLIESSRIRVTNGNHTRYHRGARVAETLGVRPAAVLLIGSTLGVGSPGRARGGDDGGRVALIAGLPACDASRAHCIALRLHVTVDVAGSAIAKSDWLAAQLATANHYFAPLEVGFEVAGVDALPASA